MRKLMAIVVATLLALALVGCSSSDSDEEGVSTEADQAGSESGSGSGTSASEGDSSGDGSSSGDATDDSSDLSGVLGQDAADCLEVSLAYGNVYLTALGLGSESDRAELEQQLEEIKGKVPADIQDDLQTIADGLADADGLVGIGEFFDSEEYKQADENVTTYLQDTCGEVGN